jgi:D-sedoheptulose 7-phosphate isomerase
MNDKSIQKQFEEQIQLLQKVSSDSVLQSKVETAITWIIDSLLHQTPLLICGNGGSASDALHFSGELVGKFALQRKALDVICLNSNVTVMTAWANDFDFNTVYARQVEAHGRKNGVFFGISTSGNSESIYQASLVANTLGMKTIGLTGKGGGKLALSSHLLIEIPSLVTPRIQEIHLPIYHYMSEKIEKAFVKKSGIEPIRKI